MPSAVKWFSSFINHCSRGISSERVRSGTFSSLRGYTYPDGAVVVVVDVAGVGAVVAAVAALGAASHTAGLAAIDATVATLVLDCELRLVALATGITGVVDAGVAAPVAAVVLAAVVVVVELVVCHTIRSVSLTAGAVGADCTVTVGIPATTPGLTVGP